MSLDNIPKAVQTISEATNICLASHINPDGDALGSILALGLALVKLGKKVTVFSADVVPANLLWLPGSDAIIQEGDCEPFELAIVCDAGSIERVGASTKPHIETAKMVMDIDHHVADGPFGELQVLDETASSTAELIWALIGALETEFKISLFDTPIALCLMTGIITDTGSFRFPNTTPKTLAIAAELLKLGARPTDIHELVYENRTFSSLKLLGRAMGSMQLSADGKVAWAHITASDFNEMGADDSETEGIVNHVRAVNGVMVGILFREVPDKKIRISLRAREGADVNKIANRFGGGGHRLASGCSSDLPLDEAERAVVMVASELMTSGN